MKKIFASLLLLLSINNAYASDESWYSFWSFGFNGSMSYDSATESTLSGLEALPGISRGQFHYDLLGFYWPMLTDGTLLGVVISADADRLSVDGTSTYMQVNQSTTAFSAMHFISGTVGDGFFVRGDLGISQASVTVGNSGGSITSNSDTAGGVGIGVGYGFPVSSQTRVVVGLLASSRNIDGDTYQSTSLYVGGLW